MNVLDFEHAGLPCRVVKTDMGHFCGYVGVSDCHPWHGKCYSEKVDVPESVMNRTIDVDKVGVINLLCASVSGEDMDSGKLDIVLAVDVHGGLTFAQQIAPGGPSDAASWWFGYACAHTGDDPITQDEPYCVAECRSLAEQLTKVIDANANEACK